MRLNPLRRDCHTMQIAGFAFAIFATLVSAGEKYALVVGVEKYRPTQLARLRFAEDDAIALGDALEALGFNVVVMEGNADDPDLEPSTANDIRRQIAAIAKDKSSDDTILVALSGHGVQLKNDTRTSAGDKECYFCPERTVLNDSSTMLPLSKVVSTLKSSTAGQKLLIVDACRNEIRPASSDKSTSPVEIELDPAGVSRSKVPTGLQALFSCSRGEKSWELADKQHGAFMFHVLEYLTGKAGASRYPDKKVAVTELFSYSQSKTKSAVKNELGERQTPSLLTAKSEVVDWSLGDVVQQQGLRPDGSVSGLLLTDREIKSRRIRARQLLEELERELKENQEVKERLSKNKPVLNVGLAFGYALLNDVGKAISHSSLTYKTTEDETVFAPYRFAILGILERLNPDDSEVQGRIRRELAELSSSDNDCRIAYARARRFTFKTYGPTTLTELETVTFSEGVRGNVLTGAFTRQLAAFQPKSAFADLLEDIGGSKAEIELLQLADRKQPSVADAIRIARFHHYGDFFALAVYLKAIRSVQDFQDVVDAKDFFPGGATRHAVEAFLDLNDRASAITVLRGHGAYSKGAVDGNICLCAPRFYPRSLYKDTSGGMGMHGTPTDFHQVLGRLAMEDEARKANDGKVSFDYIFGLLADTE